MSYFRCLKGCGFAIWCAGYTTSRPSTLPVLEQERVIGRTKPSSVELEASAMPATAHRARVTIEDEHGDERPIYRRSVPYGTLAEPGLLFVTFSADRTRFDAMLARIRPGR